MKNPLVVALIVIVLLFVLYQYDKSLFGILRRSEGWADAKAAAPTPAATGATPSSGAAAGQNQTSGAKTVAAQQKNLNVAKTQVKPTGSKSAGAKKKEGFGDFAEYSSPAEFGSSESPAGCYPRDQLTPGELLPKDMNSVWAQQNPMGTGSLKGKNFLSAGALLGVNTVGQSLRNANLQLRSEPSNPMTPISIFNISTITPDISHRSLEIG
jgi:hypothetical protein